MHMEEGFSLLSAGVIVQFFFGGGESKFYIFRYTNQSVVVKRVVAINIALRYFFNRVLM